MTEYQKLLRNSRYQKKYRTRLVKRHGSEIINDFALARSTYNFQLKDIGIKYGFTRERARQIFLELYRQPYRFYQKRLYNARLRGKRFGRLIAINEDGKNNWICICDCGNKIITKAPNLLFGNTRSCGCTLKTHGMSRTKAYQRWTNMLRRCRAKDNPLYKYYGGRGIEICENWLKFENFYRDMGECPKGLTIERIENNGNYEPSNCKWGTYKEQANNRRAPEGELLFEFNGKKLNRSQWAKKAGINYTTLLARLNHNWPMEKALEQPKAARNQN